MKEPRGLGWILARPYLPLAAAGVLLLGCITYCTTLWVPPAARSFIMPDIALICGLYCAQRHSILAWLTILTGLCMLLGAWLMWRGKHRAGATLAVVCGALTIPVGVLALGAGYLAWRKENENREKR
jgi:hypothetical protein